jgi:DNA-binding transcriptional LysR family regulator
MEMQQVRYYLTLARTLNFTRAAEECNVSQPSLTRAIRLLEEELGGELIRRERSQSHLTELGNRMLPLLQQCYESALSAKSLARSIKTNTVAPLTIAVSNTVDLEILAAPLGEVARVYGGLQLKVRRGGTAAIGELLKSGEVELAIAGPLGETWERLDRWDAFTEPFRLVLAADHARGSRGEWEPSDFAGERILINSGCEMAKEVATFLAACGVAAHTHEVENDRDLAALASANLGIGLRPLTAARSGGLRCLAVKGLDLSRPISIYGVAGRRRSPPATALLNLIRAADWSHLLN